MRIKFEKMSFKYGIENWNPIGINWKMDGTNFQTKIKNMKISPGLAH